MSSCKTRDLPETEKSGKDEERTYAFYSRELSKVFDSLDELKAAEDEFHAKQNEKMMQGLEKKHRADEVESAYKNYIDVKEKALKDIAEAESKWIELRDKFASDYGGYHMTYSDVNGKKTVTFGDIVNTLFNW